jgi:FkbM family methyltransferase
MIVRNSSNIVRAVVLAASTFIALSSIFEGHHIRLFLATTSLSGSSVSVPSNNSHNDIKRDEYNNDNGNSANTVDNTNTPKVTEYPPVECESFLHLMKEKQHPQQVTDPNEGKNYTTRTITTSPFWWSVHHQKFDPVRWTRFEQGIYYERAQGTSWETILNEYTKQSQSTIVLDVGGNIGYYALLTASLGHVVHSFEPNLINVLRFCESIVLNNWQENRLVQVHPVGISNQINTLPFFLPSNPGAGSFETQNTKASYELPVILLDTFVEDQGWFTSRPIISILKEDVEGYEGPAILGARRLLHSHMVQNIFAGIRIVPSTRPALQLLWDAGYRLYKVGGWTGPNTPCPVPNNDQLVDLLFTNTSLFKRPREEYVNMWWKLPEEPDL